MLRIVAAFDGSKEASGALDRLSWFDREGLSVVIVTVVVGGPALDENGVAVEADPGELASARSSADEAVSQLRSRGIHAESRVVAGDPAQAILELADSMQADLIVTGCRGLGRAKRLVFGSVSMAILNDASCPVLVVR